MAEKEKKTKEKKVKSKAKAKEKAESKTDKAKTEPKKDAGSKKKKSKKGGKAEKEKKVDVVKKALSKGTKKKKQKRVAPKGKVYILSTFNNTVVTVTDQKGEVLSWSSGGVIGYKGTRKSTPLAAARATKDAMTKADKYGLKEVEVFVKGAGPGKETAVKSLGNTGVKVKKLIDNAKFPHNGCRARKRKR